MKWAIGIGIVWIMGILFYLALFKAAARGDKILEEYKSDIEEDEDIN